MAGDIRLILALLQQTLDSSKDSSSTDMMPGTAPAAPIATTRSSRAPALAQRSASEPQASSIPTSASTNGNATKIQASASHSLFR